MRTPTAPLGQLLAGLARAADPPSFDNLKFG
jgi:hypothetical protein